MELSARGLGVVCAFVCYRSDFTVISGDAIGHVKLWDGRIGTLMHSFASHRADVMSIALYGSDVSSVGKKGGHGVSFVTGSVDGKVIVFKALPDPDSASGVSNHHL